MTYEAIAYTYDADVHCPPCTAQRFGSDCVGQDRKGHEVHAVSPFERWWDPTCPERAYLMCGDCAEVIGAAGPSADSVRQDGAAAGRGAQFWLELDSPADAARILISVIDDDVVDDDVVDDVVPYPLSGEWVDDSGSSELLRHFGFADDDEDSGDARDTLSRWEESYRGAFEWALARRCREYLKDAARFNRSDVTEAYAAYCHDFNDPRSAYVNRKACQLRRVGRGPRPSPRYDTLNPNALGIYLSIVGRSSRAWHGASDLVGESV